MGWRKRSAPAPTVVHIIRCNDSIEGVVINDLARAEQILAEKRAKDIEDYVRQCGEEYRQQRKNVMYWRVDDIEAL